MQTNSLRLAYDKYGCSLVKLCITEFPGEFDMECLMPNFIHMSTVHSPFCMSHTSISRTSLSTTRCRPLSEAVACGGAGGCCVFCFRTWWSCRWTSRGRM